MSSKAKKDLSHSAKERINTLLQNDIDECGRIVRYIRQHSQSREVLLKAAKKTASQEQSMDNTLMNLRTIDALLEKATNQANLVGKSMEDGSIALSDIYHIL